MMRILIVLVYLCPAVMVAQPHPEVLQGEWSFGLDPINVGIEQEWFLPDFPVEKWDKVAVPHCFSVDPRYYRYTGTAWYFKRFARLLVPEGYRAVIRFEAVFYKSRVWLNGKQVGDHEGGYTPFEVDITDALSDGNSLAVRVNTAEEIRQKQKVDRNAFVTRRYETDILIAGVGMAGVCAALSAARNGSKVILIQNRSRLGGNASSEIRMHVKFNTIQLVFDTGLHRTLRISGEDRVYHMQERHAQPETVADYKIEARNRNKMTPLVEAKDNYQRLVEHKFQPTEADAIRITVQRTNGDALARIFEVRCYMENGTEVS